MSRSSHTMSSKLRARFPRELLEALLAGGDPPLERFVAELVGGESKCSPTMNDATSSWCYMGTLKQEQGSMRCPALLSTRSCMTDLGLSFNS